MPIVAKLNLCPTRKPRYLAAACRWCLPGTHRRRSSAARPPWRIEVVKWNTDDDAFEHGRWPHGRQRVWESPRIGLWGRHA